MSLEESTKKQETELVTEVTAKDFVMLETDGGFRLKPEVLALIMHLMECTPTQDQN